jgi:hypothetical protein
MFDKEAVDTLQDQGNASGMSRFEAWSDTLFIDIDNDPDAVTSFREYFRNQNTTYSMWESGGKGVHFHLPTPLYHHRHMPSIHAKLVAESGIRCDTSLYRHNSLFRLPGTTHQKTRKIKTLLEEHQGVGLTLPEQMFSWADNLKEVTYTKLVEYDKSETEHTLLKAIHLIMNEPMQGTRYMSLWSLAKRAAETGFSEDFTTELLEVVNERWQNQKPQEEISRAVLEAFSRTSS